MSSKGRNIQVSTRSEAKRLRRDAHSVFNKLSKLEPGDSQFAGLLLELTKYEGVIDSLVEQWIGSGNERVRLTAELLQNTLDMPSDQRPRYVMRLHINYLEGLRKSIELALGGKAITLEVPIGDQGPHFSQVENLLNNLLVSRSFGKRHNLQDELRRVRRIVIPALESLADSLLVKLDFGEGVVAHINVQLVPETRSLPLELQKAFNDLRLSPGGAAPALDALRSWQPSSNVENKKQEMAQMLYDLYAYGYGATLGFDTLKSRYLDVLEKERINKVAQLLQTSSASSALDLNATLDQNGELNAISDAQVISSMVDRFGIRRGDIVALNKSVPRRTGKFLLPVALAGDFITKCTVRILAPAPVLPEILKTSLVVSNEFAGDEFQVLMSQADDEAILDSLKDETIHGEYRASHLAQHVELLERSCRLLLQAGFFHRMEFKQRLVAYCLAKAYVFGKCTGSEERILSRRLYLTYLSLARLQRETWARYDTTSEVVLEKILPTYLPDSSNDVVVPTEWCTEQVSVDAFGESSSLAAMALQVYKESPLALARALDAVSQHDQECILTFIDAIDPSLAYGSVRDTLTFATLLSACEGNPESVQTTLLVTRLLGGHQVVMSVQDGLARLVDLAQEFTRARDFYRVGDTYVRLTEHLVHLKREVDLGVLSASSHDQSLVLSRSLARLQEWFEARFMEDSINDPNLKSQSLGAVSSQGRWVYMSREGFVKARQLLVEYEQGLEEAIQLRMGGGADSGDTYHDSFSFEEGERQERMYRRLIWDLKQKLNVAQIVDVGGEQVLGMVAVGTTVRVKFLDTSETQVFTIFGEFEADPERGIISDKSPLGAAVLGSQVGNIVGYSVGSESFQVKIIEIL